jgi:hypothetical protein
MDILVKKQWKVLGLSLIYPGLGHLYSGSVLLGISQILFVTLIIFFILTKHYYVLIPFLAMLWIIYPVHSALNTPDDGIKVTADFKKRLCPECESDVPLEQEDCLKCHKRLKDVLFYSIGSDGWIDYPDVEINKKELLSIKKV